jgi:hypothetical protein
MEERRFDEADAKNDAGRAARIRAIAVAVESASSAPAPNRR